MIKLYLLCGMPGAGKPIDEIKKRLAVRNQGLPPNSCVVTAEDVDAWLPMFEPPQADEPGVIRVRG